MGDTTTTTGTAAGAAAGTAAGAAAAGRRKAGAKARAKATIDLNHPLFAHVEAIAGHTRALIAGIGGEGGAADTGHGAGADSANGTAADTAHGTAAAQPDFWTLVTLAETLERAYSTRALFDTELVNHLTSADGRAAAGTSNTTAFLRDQLGISQREAAERVAAAQLDADVEPAKQVTDADGNPVDTPDIEPRLSDQELADLRKQNREVAREAMATGTLTNSTRAGIRSALKNLLIGGTLTAEEIKQQVYTEIGQLTGQEIVKLADTLVAESNKAAENGHRKNNDLRKRGIYLSKPDIDGCVKVSGTLDAASSALAVKLFNAHNKARKSADLAPGCHDERTYSQRNADAFGRILRDAASWTNEAAGTESHGLATIVAVGSSSDFPHGTFTTNVGIDLTLEQLLRLGIQDRFLYALLDEGSSMAPINMQMWSGYRSASFEQRAALQIIDGCCQYPGCDKPLDQCDVHHIVAFIAGGRTDLENLVAMCRTHHSQNDDTRRRPNHGNMTDRTAETHFRAAWVQRDANGVDGEPRFNNGPTTRKAPGYVPPPDGKRASDGKRPHDEEQPPF